MDGLPRPRGQAPRTPAVLVPDKKYRSDSDDVGRFIADDRWCVTSSPVLKSTTAPLHAAYQRWAAQEGGDDIGLKAFAAIFDEKGFPVTQRTDTARWRQGIARAATSATPSHDALTHLTQVQKVPSPMHTMNFIALASGASCVMPAPHQCRPATSATSATHRKGINEHHRLRRYL